MHDSSKVAKLREQRTLIEFLNTDLDLAFTFLNTAKIGLGCDEEHRTAALKKAAAALAAVRYFQQRIEDAAEWQKIQARADELENALQEFEAMPN